jgi:hypothetical protein
MVFFLFFPKWVRRWVRIKNQKPGVIIYEIFPRGPPKGPKVEEGMELSVGKYDANMGTEIGNRASKLGL